MKSYCLVYIQKQNQEDPLNLSRQQSGLQEEERNKTPQFSQGDSYSNPRMRRHPEMTPSEAKDATYWARRSKNNAAARRSRKSRRTREIILAERAAKLEEQCSLLEVQIRHLQDQLNDANQSCITARYSSVHNEGSSSPGANN